MADKKITELDLLSAAEATDVFAVVDIDGLDTTKKITLANLMGEPGPIGEISSDSGAFTTLELFAGSQIDEFSIDGTLAGDSDTAVPTEKAVKTYVDTLVAPLINNSIADTLHRHSELVASDGSPDPALSVDADGNVSIVGDLFVIDPGDANDFLAIDTDTDANNIGVRSYSAGLVLETRTSTFDIFFKTDLTTTLLTLDCGTGKLLFPIGTGINEFSIDDTLAGDSDDAVPTEQAVKAYVDARAHTSLVDNSIADALHRHSELVGSDGSPDPALSIDADGKASFPTGTGINEFSTDGTLAGNSDDAVPTEKATKTYVDARANTSLVDNSIADTLHRHSELVASDGSPDPALTVGADGSISTNSDRIEINSLGSGNRNAFIDFHGDDTYTDFGLRIIRNNTGENAISQIIHRGTADFYLTVQEAAGIKFQTNSLSRLTIGSDGNIRQSDALYFATDEVRARDSGGLLLGDSTGTLGIFVEDGGLVSLANGTGINEFSTDGTLSGDSNDAVPTEKAVKTYVDSRVLSGYLHTQDTTATIWTVVHNIGSKYVNVEVIVNDKSVAGTYDEPEIEFVSSTTLTCTFEVDTEGYCVAFGGAT